MPFGEFIPPLFRWFTEMLNIPLGDFSRGTLGQPSFSGRAAHCAQHLLRRLVWRGTGRTGFSDPAQAPTVLVNFSNIGWFEHTWR